MFRQQGQQQLRGCTEKAGQSDNACGNAGIVRGNSAEKPDSGMKQSFPSFRKFQLGCRAFLRNGARKGNRWKGPAKSSRSRLRLAEPHRGSDRAFVEL